MENALVDYTHVRSSVIQDNYTMLIYQTFYKNSSVGNRGSLSYLRNQSQVRTIDVQRAEKVIGKYRSHFSFVEDCLDAHLVAAALEYLEIKDVEEDSKFGSHCLRLYLMKGSDSSFTLLQEGF